MTKQYEKSVAEVVLLNADVITTSGDYGDGVPTGGLPAGGN